MRGIQDMNLLPKLDNWQLDIFADYSGSDRKDGLISPDGDRYLIKFAEDHKRQNNMDTSYVNNVLAEYISSHILRIIGYEVHDTFIATKNEELVVACKNFTSEHEKLIEFGRYIRKHYDSGDVGRVPSFEQITYVLHNDPVLSPYEETLLQSYADRFIGDAFIGNFDRHMGNFGYLIKTDGTVMPSPIYDNGSTLFPALSETAMRTEILPHPKEIAKRALLFPKAALTVNKEKVRYYDMMASGYDSHITTAVLKMVPIIQNKMPEIGRFIDLQPFLSEIRKTFYKTVLDARLHMILQPAYERCEAKDYDRMSLDRILSGNSYTETLFEQQYAALISDKS
jgi:hypothetical protein